MKRLHVKMFESPENLEIGKSSIQCVEEDVKNWLNENTDIAIVSVTQTANYIERESDFVLIVTIIYSKEE